MTQKNNQALSVWLLVSLFSLFQFFLQVATNLMTAPLMNTFNLNDAGIGMLSSAFFYTYMLAQVPAGFLLDRYHLRKVLLCAVLLCSVGCALFAFSTHFIGAFLSRLLMGTGAGFAFVGMLFSTSVNFPPSRIALMVGLSEFIGMFGTALGQRFVPYAILSFGWRDVILSCAVIAFILWLFMYRWLLDSNVALPHNTRLMPQIFNNLKQVIKLSTVWLCGIFGFGLFSVISAFAALWGVPYLQNVHHHTYLEATSAVAFVLFGVALGCPTLGFLSNRYHPKTIMLVTGFLSLIMMLIIMYAPHPSHNILRVWLFMLGFMCSGSLLIYTFLGLSIPTAIRGTALGFCNALVLCSAVILQPAIGLIITTLSQTQKYSIEFCYNMGLLLLSILFVVAITAISFAKRPNTPSN